MVERTQFDPAKLPEIERELADRGLRVRFRDPVLEDRYNFEREEAARFNNRIMLPVLIVLFDAFIIPEMTSMPEIVRLSFALRFGLLTPVAALYVFLDWRGWLGRSASTVVSGLIVAPTVIACVVSLFTTSPAAAANYQAVPLIQLTVLACVISLRQTVIINVASVLLYYASMLTQHFVPAPLVPAMLMTDLAICVATLVFSARIDLRNRQVFLFTQQSDLRGDILASQNKALARLTRMDALTGLGNRRLLDETMAALWSDPRTRQDSVSLIMFDIDCFKQFNDTLGHQAGDECLAKLARAVASCLRQEGDTLVRYGGEEFAVVLPATSAAAAFAVAERLRLAVLNKAMPHPASKHAACVTVSLGVATTVPAASSAEELIEMADRSLYDAKRAGRNRVVAHGSSPPVAGSEATRISSIPHETPPVLSGRPGRESRSTLGLLAERQDSAA